MFSFEADGLLVEDREDLIAVLQMRFGYIPGELIAKIYEIDDLNTLQRLIISAANAADWNVFARELNVGKNSFRLVGENFNPLVNLVKERGSMDGKGEK